MAAAIGPLQTAFWGIVTFSILVVLHEMGHFLAARAFGVKVHEFMIGLPGPSLRLHGKNMDWGVTAIPLGGYVRIAGMEPGNEDELMGDALIAVRDRAPLSADGLATALAIDEERADALYLSLVDWKAVRETDDGLVLTVDGDVAELDSEALATRARARTYRGQSTTKRITILAMGVVTNVLVAVIAMTAFFSIWGYLDYTTTIAAVSKDAPAAAAGFEKGDRLVSVNGEHVTSWDDFQMLMAGTQPNDTVLISLVRDGSRRDISVKLAGKDGHGYLGVGPKVVEVRPNLIQSVKESFHYVALVGRSILDLFDPSRFSGTVKSFTGVVGVSVMAEQAAKAGPLSYAGLIVMLSLSLGLMNLLPLPPLDGGKILLEIVERLMRRPISRKVSLAVSAAGAVVLFSLIGYIMYLDIMRYAV